MLRDGVAVRLVRRDEHQMGEARSIGKAQRWAAEAGDAMTMRIVNDRGCGIITGVCPFHDRDRWQCRLDAKIDTYPGNKFPLTCPLRDGDVVVSTKAES